MKVLVREADIVIVGVAVLLVVSDCVLVGVAVKVGVLVAVAVTVDVLEGVCEMVGVTDGVWVVDDVGVTVKDTNDGDSENDTLAVIGESLTDADSVGLTNTEALHVRDTVGLGTSYSHM